MLRGPGAEEIASLIDGLGEPYRPVCRLCLLAERTPEEAALALGRPVKTVYTRSPEAESCCGRHWKGAETMTCFRPDGHLTDAALAALVRGDPLPELERLELAEHLPTATGASSGTRSC